MADQTGIEWPTCDEDGCIGIRLAATPKCLAHAHDEQREATLKELGETGEIDARGVPITQELLDQIVAAAPHDAEDRPTFMATRLDRATFQGDADFSHTTFQGDARFHGATFQGDAVFGRGGSPATFQSIAGFDEATFKAVAWFHGATFQSIAGFGQATFQGEAWFSRATFQASAGFDEATFMGGAWFGVAVVLAEKTTDIAGRPDVLDCGEPALLFRAVGTGRWRPGDCGVGLRRPFAWRPACSPTRSSSGCVRSRTSAGRN